MKSFHTKTTIQLAKLQENKFLGTEKTTTKRSFFSSLNAKISPIHSLYNRLNISIISWLDFFFFSQIEGAILECKSSLLFSSVLSSSWSSKERRKKIFYLGLQNKNAICIYHFYSLFILKLNVTNLVYLFSEKKHTTYIIQCDIIKKTS